MAAESAIGDCLGGSKALGANPKNPLQWDRLIREGFAVQSAETLKERLGITDAGLAELLGISEKTLSRARASKSRLDVVASDRLFRLARIVALAIRVLESDQGALHWLKRSQIGLGVRIPLTLLATDAGCEQVEKLLLAIEHGVYA
ncbi:MAG TPA: antitoxin Xre-like helix-turn-helix domain-containing protein [Burkholderiaceae bacterium]|jgi:putative toxin-antitoxin system antitoxin component (TIGR02293 family)